MELPTPDCSWSLGHTTNISPAEDRNGTRKIIFFPWSKLASLRGTSSGFAIEKDGVTEQNSGVGTSKAGRTTVASDSPQPRRQGS